MSESNKNLIVIKTALNQATLKGSFSIDEVIQVNNALESVNVTIIKLESELNALKSELDNNSIKEKK